MGEMVMEKQKEKRISAARKSAENFRFFKQNFNELYPKYKGKYIVIKNCAVIDFYDSFDAAVRNTLETEELGSFSVQHCVVEEIEGYNFYNNNVSFGDIYNG
jgi:hypothetical protein